MSWRAVVKEHVFEVGARRHIVVQWQCVVQVCVVIGKTQVSVAYGCYLLAYFLWKPNVVLVADGHVLSCGTQQGRVKVAVEPQLLVVAEQLEQARVCLGIGLQYVPGVVGRAVVLHNDFVQGVILRQYGVHLLAQKLLAIVGAHNYRHGEWSAVVIVHSIQRYAKFIVMTEECCHYF